ncbi:MAG: class II fructose-bisphosphate aldolase family protein [Bacilli bacterium]|nr:class II fructose-bisphosphate aldolase family protein [Bacilli bacterium]MDY5832010.1 class II fructose-bisphosphate aldolase [Candidatus Onthovivens sp.]
MPLVNLNQLYKDAYVNKYAIGAFNVDTLAMCRAVLEVSQKNKSPVILMFSEGSRAFMHPGNIKDLIENISQDITIPFAIHLDHGRSIESCISCIDEGFTSVMIDASKYSFEENVRITKQVVEYAHKHNVTVEAEVGCVEASKKDEDNFYTDPDVAIRFIKETGCDSLAVSIGTGHGLMKFKENEKPQLRFDILKKINEKLPYFPLVLHGSSSISPSLLADFNKYGGNIKTAKGIDEALLSKAASINVCKINIGTDFRMSYITGLREALAKNSDKFTPRTFLTPALEKIKECVDYKQNHIFNSVNRIKEE